CPCRVPAATGRGSDWEQGKAIDPQRALETNPPMAAVGGSRSDCRGPRHRDFRRACWKLEQRRARDCGTQGGRHPPGEARFGSPDRQQTVAGGAAAMIRSEIYGKTLRFFLAPVADLLYEDELVTEVLINGPSTIYCERAGRLERVERRFADEGVLM